MNDTTTRMNNKPVFTVPAKSVINFASGFGHKKLCDSLTFSLGSACAYRCSYCYVEDLMRKSPHLKAAHEAGLRHEDVVIRREGGLVAMAQQLISRGVAKFNDPSDRRVIYASPLVDVAANITLASETIEACKLILQLTHWQIRLLSKSNMLPRIAQALGNEGRERVIYGVSTGTLDDTLAGSFERGTAKVSKRLQSLHWLQDNGFRTFGMICPSLPQRDYDSFALDMALAVRAEQCEHIWAEVMNVRGESMTKTSAALRGAGYGWEAAELERVTTAKAAWEEYSRKTFEAHAAIISGEKLRFLQYVSAGTRDYWRAQESNGAVLL